MSNKTRYTEFKLKDGSQSIAGRRYECQHAKARLLIIHGFGEHQGRYEHVADFFSSKLIEVCTIDLIGHGVSEGRRGHIRSMDQYWDEVQALINHTQSLPDMPLYLMGHSMGGLVTASFCLKRSPSALSGIILSSPWFELAFKPNAIQLGLAKMLHRLNINIKRNAKFNYAHLANDPSVAQQYVHDPLTHAHITPKTFFEIFSAGIWCRKHADELKTPCIITHGTEDKIISLNGSRSFAQKAGIAFIPLEGAMHEPHNDYKQKEVLSLYSDWIEKSLL